MGDLPKNVMTAYFDASVDQESRICDSYVRKVEHDEKGEEFVKYVPFDSKSYQDSLGSIDLWSLNALIKAGINPEFNIHTGFGTRMEAEKTVGSAIEKINGIIDSQTTGD